MSVPHLSKYPLILLATLLTFFAAPATDAAARARTHAPRQKAAPAGQTEAGVRLFQSGDFKGAIKALRSAFKKNKDDHRALLYLGHAHLNVGDVKESRKAFDRLLEARPDHAAARAGLAYLHMLTGKRRDAEREAARALELDKTTVDAHYVIGLIRLDEGAWLKVNEVADAIIKLDPRSANAYYLKSQAALGLFNKADAVLADEGRGVYPYNAETIREAREAQPLRLLEAADNLEKYLRLKPNARDAELQREQVETLRAYARTGGNPFKAYKTSELTTKAVIVKKPDPGFTEEARRNGVTGVVRLRAVLAADGRVKDILVVKGLRDGLTERCIRAARSIKFQPAQKDGRAVSQYVTLEYNFNIY